MKLFTPVQTVPHFRIRNRINTKARLIALALIALASCGSDEPYEPSPPPSAKEVANRECRRAAERKYSSSGYDVFKFASQRTFVLKRDDGTWFSNMSIPFKRLDPLTGKNNRVLWINVECVYDGTRAKITEVDTAGFR